MLITLRYDTSICDQTAAAALRVLLRRVVWCRRVDRAHGWYESNITSFCRSTLLSYLLIVGACHFWSVSRGRLGLVHCTWWTWTVGQWQKRSEPI